ncbi:phage tail tape measure protein [Bacteroides sp.]
MMNGQAKIELMLSLKNKIRTGLNQAKKDTFKSVNTMQAKMDSLKFSLAKNSKAIVDEVPMLGNAFRLAKNPIALAAAGVVAIGKGIDYTTQKAADFNTQFRALANLNLDKSKREIDSLRRMVLDTSFDKGFNTEKAITGYFDVQSTTGKFGGEVKKIVEKQGEFANLMQADFNNYIAGTAKGMANFGFGVDKLDEFNRSAYATVKVGVTTFDQLAQVQSVYAGAAASNNQTFDTANKLLALFTVKTKSVDEAATLTKSMFNDLTKDATIKAFKKVGINVYDTSGKLKQADSIMLELNKKFRELDSDKKVMALKNQFSGSEGLIAMIQAATDKSGQLQSTFKGFEETKLDMDKTMELAKNDLNYKNEVMRNKLETLEIEIGTSLLPLKYKIAELKLAALDLVNALSQGAQGDKDKGTTVINDKYEGLIQKAASMDVPTFQKTLVDLNLDLKKAERGWKSVDGFADKIGKAIMVGFLTPRKGLGWNKVEAGINYAKLPSGDTYAGMIEQLSGIKSEFIKAWKQAYAAKKVDPKANTLSPLDPNKQTNTTGGTTTPSGDGSSLGDGVSGIVGSAKQVRNLTVNIEAFNKGGINTSNTTLQHMDTKQIEEWFTDACMRTIRSIEATY